MEIRTSLTSAELREVARMSRSWRFWVHFFATNWYATALAVTLIGVVTNGAIHHQFMPWKDFLIVLAAVAALYGYSWFRYNRKLSRIAARSAALNRTRTLEADGIHTLTEGGVTSFMPWRAFDRCMEGKLIFLLKGNDAIMAVPCDDTNRDTLRTYLRGNIMAHLLE